MSRVVAVAACVLIAAVLHGTTSASNSFAGLPAPMDLLAKFLLRPTKFLRHPVMFTKPMGVSSARTAMDRLPQSAPPQSTRNVTKASLGLSTMNVLSPFRRLGTDGNSSSYFASIFDANFKEPIRGPDPLPSIKADPNWRPKAVALTLIAVGAVARAPKPNLKMINAMKRLIYCGLLIFAIRYAASPVGARFRAGSVWRTTPSFLSRISAQ
ncbi:HIG1 domain-containing protein [Plasmodiophora brassicae]